MQDPEQAKLRAPRHNSVVVVEVKIKQRDVCVARATLADPELAIAVQRIVPLDVRTVDRSNVRAVSDLVPLCAPPLRR
jgi:hypothetical protein